jgi:hypothetical protein
MAKLKKEDQRIVVLLIGLVPDDPRQFGSQLRQGRAFTITGLCLQDGKPVVQRLFQDLIDARAGKCPGITAWRDQFSAEDSG